MLRKTRSAVVVAGATLGIVVPALPVQAQVPTRPGKVRLQGAATTVNVFRVAGTRNVYMRATTIKRTLSGTIVRSVSRIPIRWTVTKPIILDGKVVARYDAGSTGQGASQAACDSAAGFINRAESALLNAIEESSTPADYAAEQGDLEDAIDRALDSGCFVIYGVA